MGIFFYYFLLIGETNERKKYRDINRQERKKSDPKRLKLMWKKGEKCGMGEKKNLQLLLGLRAFCILGEI